MKLATTTCDFFGYTSNQIEIIEYISNAGFKNIDYAFGIDYRRNSGIFSGDLKGYTYNLKSKADELGVKFVQAHAPMGAPLDNDANFIEANLRCIDFCNELGIENIVVHSGYREGLTKEQTFNENKRFFEKLLPRAEKYGINILVENFNKMGDKIYWIDNAPDLLKMVECVNHPLFNAVWDTGHGNQQPLLPHESLKILGKYVKALHVQDNMGDLDSHLAPFFGNQNLDSLMHGLIDIGYNGYFTFEADNMLLPAVRRKVFNDDNRLLEPPLSLRIEAEKFLYQIGKAILSAYDCFEE